MRNFVNWLRRQHRRADDWLVSQSEAISKPDGLPTRIKRGALTGCVVTASGRFGNVLTSDIAKAVEQAGGTFRKRRHSSDTETIVVVGVVSGARVKKLRSQGATVWNLSQLRRKIGR